MSDAHFFPKRHRVSVTVIVLAVMALVGLGAAGGLWLFWRASGQGARQMQQVVAVGRVHEDVRTLEPALAKALAYAQLISQGDLSFQQDLTQQLERINETMRRVDSLQPALSDAEQGLWQQLRAQWHVCRRSLGGVLALTPGALWGEQALLMQAAIQRDMDQLHATLGLFEQASTRQWESTTAAARQWSFDLRRHGLVWVGGFCLLVAGGLMVLWWRVLRPLRELRRVVDAWTSGSRSRPLAIASRDEFGDLAVAWNQLLDARRAWSESEEHPAAELPVTSEQEG